MHFCSKCGNMYYIKIMKSEKKQLIYYCRNCGNEEMNIDESSVIVSKTNLKKNKQQYNHIINQYTKLDPTLPRIQTINCPNSQCASNTDDSVEKDIISIRYDRENMKYIYMCAVCNKVWQLSSK